MSHAFMPMYWGSYLKNTAHLTTEQHGAYLLLIAHCWQHGAIPPSAAERAAITKLTLSRWKAIGGTVSRFFNEDGTHTRVTEELERTDKKVTLAKIAGKKGGERSAIVRAIKRGQAIADAQAELQREAKRKRSGRLTGNEADAQAEHQAEPERTRTNQKDIDSSESVAARDPSPVEKPDEPQKLDGSLATAPRTGALRSPSRTAPQPSSELSRLVAEKGWTAQPPQNTNTGIPDFLRRTAKKETSC